MSSGGDYLQTIISNHKYDSSDDENDTEENGYNSDFEENIHRYEMCSTQQREKKVEILIDSLISTEGINFSHLSL